MAACGVEPVFVIVQFVSGWQILGLQRGDYTTVP